MRETPPAKFMTPASSPSERMTAKVEPKDIATANSPLPEGPKLREMMMLFAVAAKIAANDEAKPEATTTRVLTDLIGSFTEDRRPRKRLRGLGRPPNVQAIALDSPC